MRGATRGNDKICFAKYDHKEAPRLGPSRRTNGGRHLDLGEKIQIVHEVIVQHQLQKEVAAAHQVTAATVCILCKKANKNKGTLVKHAEFFSMFWGEMLKIIIRQIRHRTMVRSFLEAITDHFD